MLVPPTRFQWDQCAASQGTAATGARLLTAVWLVLYSPAMTARTQTNRTDRSNSALGSLILRSRGAAG